MPFIDALENCSINSINKNANETKSGKVIGNLKLVEIPFDDNCKINYNQNILKNNNINATSQVLQNRSVIAPSTNFDNTEKEVILIQLKIPQDLTPSFGIELNTLGLTIVSGGINHRNAYVSVESVRENSPADFAGLKVI